MFWNKEKKEIMEDLELLEVAIIRLEKRLEELETTPKTPLSTQEFSNRVTDLEVKMSKLWNLLIKLDARGNEKINPYGRRMFGGRSKELQ